MKNLDIENLERTNVYDCPDHFFDDVQRNVLQEVALKKSGKIIKLNWMYAAAASVALILGMTIFLDQKENENKINANDAAITRIVSDNAASTTISQTQTNPTVAEVTETNLTFQQIAHPIKKTSTTQLAVTKPEKALQKENATPKNAELQMEQVLANFPVAELADLGRNAEQDVYLDLYN